MKKCVLMIYPRWLTAVILILLVTTVANAAPPPVSGRVVNGFRVLTLESADIPVHLTVYRGDYVQFIDNQGGETPLIRIPELGIETRPGSDHTSVPYFKMKRSGRFVLLVDRTEGLIEVVDYRQPNYRELTAADAFDMIQRQGPLILDVRTDLEYKKMVELMKEYGGVTPTVVVVVFLHLTERAFTPFIYLMMQPVEYQSR